MVSPTAVVSLISTTVRADNGLGVTGLVDGGKILMVCGIPIDGGHDNWDNHPACICHLEATSWESRKWCTYARRPQLWRPFWC
jgi:hypothetical protein